MENEKKLPEGRDGDILFSRTVKAGQRFYYIDVKRNNRGELYLNITESKKMQNGAQEAGQASFEKHRIFLFPEDFAKFAEALGDAVRFVREEEGEIAERQDEDGAIKLDLEF